MRDGVPVELSQARVLDEAVRPAGLPAAAAVQLDVNQNDESDHNTEAREKAADQRDRVGDLRKLVHAPRLQLRARVRSFVTSRHTHTSAVVSWNSFKF